MENILDFSREELGKWFEKKGIRRYRADQVFKWLYLKLAGGFDEMTDLGKELRSVLNEHFTIGTLYLEKKEKSRDTTEKFLHRLYDGEYVESVLIPEKDHFTLCVSSQAGCAMDCGFCLTAKGGFKRNLTMGEIVGQVRDARRHVKLMGLDPLKLSNIVFMGMGEPLANYDNVLRSLGVILDHDFGLKFFQSQGDSLHFRGCAQNDSTGPGHGSKPCGVSECRGQYASVKADADQPHLAH